MPIQGQQGCQIFRKIVYNYVPISDFATRSLNLRKPKRFRNFCKEIFYFLLKNANYNQRSTFPVYFLSILNILNRKFFFDQNLAIEISVTMPFIAWKHTERSRHRHRNSFLKSRVTVSKSQDFRTAFKIFLACIFLSVRANLLCSLSLLRPFIQDPV
jgi:hypothetical protein